MTDRRPPDDEEFGGGSGAESTGPAAGAGRDQDALVEGDVGAPEIPPVDEFDADPGDDPIGAVTDFMDDLIEADALDEVEVDEAPVE